MAHLISGLFSAVLFLSVSSVQAASNSCTVPNGSAKANVGACMASPSLKWAYKPQQLTREQISTGPENNADFSGQSEVYCAFRPHPKSQTSPKFRCFRTTERNFRVAGAKPEYYNKKGVIVPAAVSVGLEGTQHDSLLLDSAGRPIADGQGAYEEGEELKVKYFTGGKMSGSHFQGNPYITEDRHSEVFTEVASSRVFWSLGIPVDYMYNVGHVNCFGCSADPFTQTRYQEGATATFTDAAIELKMPGKKIAEEWSWRSVSSSYRTWSAQQRIDYEALLLAAQLISYHNDLDQQNRLACEAGQMDKTTRECKSPVAMINDVGSTFGGKKKGLFSQNPRGNLGAYQKNGGRAFANASNCTVMFPLGGVSRVSREGLEAFKVRLNNLDSAKIREIFIAAKFGRMQPAVMQSLVGEANVIEAWAQELERRVQDIQSAQCP